MFENVVTDSWQKTSEIAQKVGCVNGTALKYLNILKDNNLVEMEWVYGVGAEGTRAWRKCGKSTKMFTEIKNGCKFSAPSNKCSFKENSTNICSQTACPLIIRR
jgi:hypothetical protein